MHTKPTIYKPVASVVLADGLFIIDWNSSPQIPWIATIIGVCMMGFGYYTIFTSALNYLIDTSQRWGASAITANTFVRSVLAATFPLIHFRSTEYPNSVHFWFYGPRIRAIGKYSSNMG